VNYNRIPFGFVMYLSAEVVPPEGYYLGERRVEAHPSGWFIVYGTFIRSL